jgi:hypothetical protein
MQRAERAESGIASGDVRGVASAAPRATPLTIVSGAVAGDDLQRVAASAAEALGCPVAIAIPSRGEPVVGPPDSLPPETVRAIAQYATAAIQGLPGELPSSIAEAVPLRIGDQVLGVVASAPGSALTEQRAWLEAVAAAAAVAAMMREGENGNLDSSRLALLQALCAGPPQDVGAFVEHASRLGFDLSLGAVAFCAIGKPPPDLAPDDDVLLGEVSEGKLLGLAPLGQPAAASALTLTAKLSKHGMAVGVSSPRRDPAALHSALREAELLAELAAEGDTPAVQEETYRLLIGVLLRDPGELEQLCASTISTLVSYDAEHDTELLGTLQAFLAHHGSTTETAVAMGLHRHTVGYRLSRVQEVSGLSPYESEGRERLSLGLKAQQILEAGKRLFKPG